MAALSEGSCNVGPWRLLPHLFRGRVCTHLSGPPASRRSHHETAAAPLGGTPNFIALLRALRCPGKRFPGVEPHPLAGMSPTEMDRQVLRLVPAAQIGRASGTERVCQVV